MRENGELLFIRYKVSVLQDGKDLETGFTNNGNKAIALYT